MNSPKENGKIVLCEKELKIIKLIFEFHEQDNSLRKIVRVLNEKMRAVIELILAVVFKAVTGTTVLNFSSKAIKKEALIKVQRGLPSLEKYTKQLIYKSE